MKKRALAPVMWILLGAYPVLFLYAQNLRQLHLLDLWAPLLIALGASAAIFLLWLVIMRCTVKAGLMTVLWAVVFWSAPYLERFLYWLGIGIFSPSVKLKLFFALLALLLLLFPLLIYRVRATPPQVVQAVSVMTLVLIGLSLVQIVPHEAQRLFQALRRMKTREHFQPQQAAAQGELPNIIHVVLDAYGRADVLKTRYGLDNEPFLQELERRRFYVMRESAANYNLTLLCLSSMLNMRYVEGAMGAPDDTAPLSDTVRNSLVRKELQQRGYRYVVFESGWPLTDIKDADEFHATTINWTPFQSTLLAMTPIPQYTTMRGMNVMDFFQLQRQRVRNVFGRVPEVRDLDAPVYVFAHVLSPHVPFVFGADGSNRQWDRPYSARDGSDYLDDGGSPEEYREGYREQLQYINTLVLQMVDRVQKRMTRPTIIMVHGDHGPAMGLVWGDVDASDVRERMCNFAAIYLPDEEYGDLYPRMSLVNYYRLIFTRYLNAAYPPLKDKSLFTDWYHLYTYTTIQPERLGLDFNEPPPTYANTDRPRSPRVDKKGGGI